MSCPNKALVKPVLEYASTVWSPQTQRDIDTIENVQRQAATTNTLSSHLQLKFGIPYFNMCMWLTLPKLNNLSTA